MVVNAGPGRWAAKRMGSCPMSSLKLDPACAYSGTGELYDTIKEAANLW